MAQNDIGIDLGTTTIIIAQEGKGVVLNQPSVVAMDTRKKTVLEAGDKALAMVGRTPNYISAIFPLKDGVISDHTMTRELICRFVKQVYSSHMVKPRVAVCVPAAITGIESDAVVEAVVAAGARQVYLIDEPIAAALGSGIDITLPDGRMIIDIGGGTTDIAVLSLGGKVKATSVRVAGNHYDEEILKHVRNKYSIAIGQRTAEELKKHVACCPQKTDFHESMEIKGRSLLTGLLTGGGAQLHGLTEYLSQELKVEVTVSPDPVNCVALGTAQSLSLGDKLETGFTDATPRIGRR